jgi:hypothetical protein
MKRYFIIKFNDLSQEIQDKIKTSITDEVIKTKGNELVDLYIRTIDPATPDPNDIRIAVEEEVQKACDKAWQELEVEVTL